MLVSVSIGPQGQVTKQVPQSQQGNEKRNVLLKLWVLQRHKYQLILKQYPMSFFEHLSEFFCIVVSSLQLPILASSVVSLYFLELTDIFQPVHSGYSCNDRSLSLPYILPRQEVCPLPLLFSLAFAAPTATVSKPPALRTLIRFRDFDYTC